LKRRSETLPETAQLEIAAKLRQIAQDQKQ
jgi:hypothetical protein